MSSLDSFLLDFPPIFGPKRAATRTDQPDRNMPSRELMTDGVEQRNRPECNLVVGGVTQSRMRSP